MLRSKSLFKNMTLYFVVLLVCVITCQANNVVNIRRYSIDPRQAQDQSPSQPESLAVQQARLQDEVLNKARSEAQSQAEANRYVRLFAERAKERAQTQERVPNGEYQALLDKEASRPNLLKDLRAESTLQDLAKARAEAQAQALARAKELAQVRERPQGQTQNSNDAVALQQRMLPGVRRYLSGVGIGYINPGGNAVPGASGSGYGSSRGYNGGYANLAAGYA